MKNYTQLSMDETLGTLSEEFAARPLCMFQLEFRALTCSSAQFAARQSKTVRNSSNQAFN